MKLRTLNQLRPLRTFIVGIRLFWMRRRGIEIGEGSTVSMSAKLRGRIRIGRYTYVAFKTRLDTGRAQGEESPIDIGDNCFIGGGSTILPGTQIGDDCIVAAGAVVSGTVPPRSIVAGNPARVIRSDIKVGQYGVLEVAVANTRKLYRP